MCKGGEKISYVGELGPLDGLTIYDVLGEGMAPLPYFVIHLSCSHCKPYLKFSIGFL